MKVIEFRIVGVVSEDVVEKVANCIKTNVELIFLNEVIHVDGLTVEATVID